MTFKAENETFIMEFFGNLGPLCKAAMVQKTLSASGVTPAVLAQAVLFQRALSASGLAPEEILGILTKVTSPKFTEEEINQLLRKVLEKKSVSKDEIEAISKMQKALREGNLVGQDPLSDELQARDPCPAYPKCKQTAVIFSKM